jgi:acetyl-CoA acetyltransferase
MGKLRSVRRSGTVTVATANQPCDGAAVCLVASEKAAEKHNLTPRALVGPC